MGTASSYLTWTNASTLLACIIIGWSTYVFIAYLMKRSTEKCARGTIVDVRRLSEDGDLMYYPYIRYTDDRGETVEFRSTYSTSWRHWRVGRRVTVLLYPNERKPPELWLPTWACLLYAFALFIAVMMLSVR